MGDLGSIPGLGRSPGGEHGNPRRYPCLENPQDRGAWWATVHAVAKSWTRLSNFTLQFPIRHLQKIVILHLQKILILYSTSKLQLKYELSHFSHIQLFATCMDQSPPWLWSMEISAFGILQARILEWIAISSSRSSSWPGNLALISYVSCIGKWILSTHLKCTEDNI